MKLALPVFTILTFALSYYFTMLCYQGKKLNVHIFPWLPLIVGLLLAPFGGGGIWNSYNPYVSTNFGWVALYGECISIVAFFLGRYVAK